MKNGGSWLGKHSFKTQGSRFYLLIFLASYLPSFLPTYLPTYLSYLNDFLASYLNLPTCITYQLTVYLPNLHNQYHTCTWLLTLYLSTSLYLPTYLYTFSPCSYHAYMTTYSFFYASLLYLTTIMHTITSNYLPCLHAHLYLPTKHMYICLYLLYLHAYFYLKYPSKPI